MRAQLLPITFQCLQPLQERPGFGMVHITPSQAGAKATLTLRSDARSPRETLVLPTILRHSEAL